MDGEATVATEAAEGGAPDEVAAESGKGSLLREKGFLSLLCATTLSKLGDVSFMVAVPWLVLKATGSPALLGMVMTAFAVPRAALMLVGGAIGDRYDPRKILLVVSLAQATTVCLIGLSPAQDGGGLGYVFVLIVAFGLADAFVPAATKVFLTSFIERERLRDGMAILQSAGQICWLVGPAFAGLLVAHVGLRDVFFFDALSFLPYAITMIVLRTKREATAGPSGIGKGIMEGLRYVRAERRLAVLVGTVAAVNFCMPAVTELGLASISLSRYGSASVFGGLITCVGIGSLVGLWVAKTVGKEVAINLALTGTVALLSVSIASLATQLPVWGFYAQGIALGALAGFINLHVTIFLQLNSQPKMLGRVMSLVAFSSAAAAPFSLMAGGLLAGTDLTGLFLVVGVALAVVAIGVGSSGRLGVQWQQ